MNNRESNKQQATETKLDIRHSNHILFKYENLCFEILGGVNPENYHSLRVMLVTGLDRNKHRDNVDLLNHDQTSNYIKKASEITGIHPTKIKVAVSELTNQLEEYKLELQNNHGKPMVKSYQLSDTEREQAIDTLKKPKLLSVINTMIGETGVIGNETNRMILFLTYLTRKTNTSLHAVIQSPYNYLQNKLALLIPDEEKVLISNISDNALFYYEENALQNKVLLVEDTVTNRKKLLPLIGFQTNNLVTKTTVTKDEFAKLVTVQKQIRGNVSLSISTREEQAFNQNGALSFVLNEDTGSVQDEKVLMYQRKQSAGYIKAYNEQKIISQIQNIQRALSNITVINPYALDIQLPEQIKNKQITNLHYLRFIEVVTFLKQHQRSQKHDTETGEIYIETTAEDIREANQLLSEILVNKSDVLNKPTRLFLEQLKSHLNASKQLEQSFTLHEISTAFKQPKTTIVRYAKTLVENGFITATNEGNKKDGYRYQLNDANEYNELKTTINTVMNNTISNIENKVAQTEDVNQETTANQNESGTLNVSNSEGIDEVNHKNEQGTKQTTIKNTNSKNKAA